MSDPISGTGLAGGVLTGASVYGFLSGTDYGVVFGAFAGAVFYIATAADLSAAAPPGIFSGVVYCRDSLFRGWWVQSWLRLPATVINHWMLLVP